MANKTMNSIEDIAKLAIEEISAELDDGAMDAKSSDTSLASASASTNARPIRAAGAASQSANSASNARGGGFEIVSDDDMASSSAFSVPQTHTNEAKQEAIKQGFKQAVPRAQDIEQNIASIANSLNTSPLNTSPLNTSANYDPNGERIFLNNLKERIEVLFAGLNTSDENTSLRLDLTIRFLEFLLAHIQTRLSNLQK